MLQDLDLLSTSAYQVCFKLKRFQLGHKSFLPIKWAIHAADIQHFYMQARSHEVQVDKEGKESKQQNLFIWFKLNYLLLIIRSSASNFHLNIIAHF